VTEIPLARYYVVTALLGQTVQVDVVDGDTGLVVARFPPRSPIHLPTDLAQQVADLLNVGEAERQRTERLKDQLLEEYSRWLEAASPKELMHEAQVRLPVPEPV
jgi:hypothetical protein